MAELIRCEWLGDSPPQIYIDYHDNEWGRPVHDDNKLFEMLTLEGMQAGLSWLTVLKKGKIFERHSMVLMWEKLRYMVKAKLRNC